MASEDQTVHPRTTLRHPPDNFELSCRCPAAAEEDCPLTVEKCQQRLDLRKSGFAAHANALPRDEIALRLLCAFNNLANWKKAPPGWWFHPNEASKAAWERVADEAQKIFGDTERPSRERMRRGVQIV